MAGSWASPALPSIWGLPVVDPRVALLLDREQVAVLVSTEDRDNFVKNMVTILAEVRAGLAVLDTAGVLRVTLPEETRRALTDYSAAPGGCSAPAAPRAR